MNCTPNVRQCDILLTGGVKLYAKRDTKVHRRVQELNKDLTLAGTVVFKGGSGSIWKKVRKACILIAADEVAKEDVLQSN